MSSKEWEALFLSGRHVCEYPWSNLVGLVTRFFNPETQSPRVLELGCGMGANIRFFLDKGFEYHSVEGARPAVSLVREKFGNSVNVTWGDFSRGIPYAEDFFDIVVDRSSAVHNREGDIKNTVLEVRRCLKREGLFFALDWFSSESYALPNGKKIEPFTIGDCSYGYLAGCGVTHFFDKRGLEDLFREGWEFLYLAEKSVLPHRAGPRIAEDRSLKEASWDIVLRNIK